MANTRAIKRRIRTIASVQKTTNAMQLVAASKMRRAQARALAARPYARRMRTVLSDLASEQAESDDEETTNPLLLKRPLQRVTLVIVSPNRGLCGGLPGNLNRAAGNFALEHGTGTMIVAAGKKGRDFFARARYNLVAEFLELGDYPSLSDTLPISRIAIDDYRGRRTDGVFLAYSQFVNTVTQRPVIQQILPVEPPEEAPASNAAIQWIFEPSPAEVLDELLPRYVEMQVYNAFLENAASEQSARMVAMRNATDAARDMIDSLTLALNKARQDQITAELLDIVGGAAAITG
ncbi:MAG TPA: ATP synthase F1 subunit gamma [Dehalococcoidia bacterium]|nr:ATP synthase F1 subunit gamma [Dehalococcoidia bacterium]